MKRIIGILLMFVLLFCNIPTLSETIHTPPMQLRIAIPIATLWSEPTNRSSAVKDENDKNVKMKVGEVVYPTQDQFGRSDYGSYCYVTTESGYEGYAAKKYLIYGYKICLEGNRSQNIYRTEWAAKNGVEDIGTVSAYRKNEELIVIDETVDCLHVLTVKDPESIEGYIPQNAYYSYVYDLWD